MQEKANRAERMRLGPATEVSIQRQLRALGGREIGIEEDWRADEHYGVSVKGRRFVFRDPTAFYRFEEFVRTALTPESTSLHDWSAKSPED